MNIYKDLDAVIAAWVDDGPTSLPNETSQAIAVGIRTVRRQRPGIGLPSLRRPTIDLRRLSVALGSAAVLVVAAAVALNFFYSNRQGGLGASPSPDVPRQPFVGVWISTSDSDGGRQTMTVARGDNNTFVIVVTDTIASVCELTPSTMTGTGSVEGNNLVMQAPDFRCDDGSEPQALSGPPLAEQLRNFTLVLDPRSDSLSDGFGGIWLREGAATPSPEPVDGPTRAPTTSGSMWPQSTLEEVRQAQERADTGDPAYTWQVATRWNEVDQFAHIELELVDRFIREVLGWEAYLLNEHEGGDFNPSVGAMDGWADGALTNQRYLRCAPGRTNPLYPLQPDSEQPGESCAPTLDDLRYESVSLDLAQLDRQGRDGIWVVSRWELTAPFAQVDPVAVEAQATERLEEFLAARIAGSGAEGHVRVQDDAGAPLLYATTSGDSYERYEFERVDPPMWPYGKVFFSARLFADGDATVVEQIIAWEPGEGLWLDYGTTTENGQPVDLSHTSSDGEVTVSAPSTWDVYWPTSPRDPAVDVWFGMLWAPVPDRDGDGYTIGFVDPVAYDAWCAAQLEEFPPEEPAQAGSPLLSAPADAATIAQELIADPDYETTAPVAARVAGLEAVSIDAALAPGGTHCVRGFTAISRWIHALATGPGLRLRLYLVDLPEGMSVQTLAITVVAPEEHFEEFIEETAPIIESIEFHTP